jgi:hypothetical protein
MQKWNDFSLIFWSACRVQLITSHSDCQLDPAVSPISTVYIAALAPQALHESAD